ncbi:unnamed protein product, partial [Didymodactylos carnosus]
MSSSQTLFSSVPRIINYNNTMTFPSTHLSDISKEIYDPRITKPFAIICLFIGSIGNSLSFVVFTNKELRIYSTFRYLAYLAIVDLCVLYCGLGHIILRDYFKFDIRTSHLVLCKLHTFFTYITTQLSSWVLALVSIDRAVACTIMQKHFCKAQSADRIFAGMCLAVSIINSHILFFMGKQRTIYAQRLTNSSSLVLTTLQTT